MMDEMCDVAGCANPRNPGSRVCVRHIENPDAPPASIYCECVTPDVELLTIYGPSAAFCRWCGSPMETVRA